MRKIVGGLAISLDGFMEGSNGEWDWMIMDKDFDMAAHMSRFDSLLMGRMTYEKLGKRNPGMSSYVVSGTLKEVEEGYSLIHSNVVNKIKDLKNRRGKDIAVYGGAIMLSWLLENKLVDELVIPVMPLILGSGKIFLTGLSLWVGLTLVECKKFNSGVVIFHYKIN